MFSVIMRNTPRLSTSCSSMTTAIIFIILAYLLGSISSAIITCRLMGLQDPREQGSGNPGATNVLRTGGKTAALITLLGDVLKGLIPVAGAGMAGLPGPLTGVVALAAVGGHLYPLYFGFQGGKGVATVLGALFGLSWLLGLIWVLTWVAVAAAFRFSSLAALVAMSLTPVYVQWLLGSIPLTLIMAALAALILFRHRSNLRNLLAGTEPRIGGKT